MTFTTKYELGQELFYIWENEVRSSMCTGIDITQTRSNPDNTGPIVIVYILNHTQRWREEDIAPSKAELISRL